MYGGVCEYVNTVMGGTGTNTNINTNTNTNINTNNNNNTIRHTSGLYYVDEMRMRRVKLPFSNFKL